MPTIPEFRVVRNGDGFALRKIGEHFVQSGAITSSRDLWPAMAAYTVQLAQECVGASFLDRDNHLLGIAQLSCGCDDSVEVSPLQVIRAAVMVPGCRKVIVGHNHLLDPARPSAADMHMFEQLRACLEGIFELYDNVIVSPNQFYSFRERGHFGRQSEAA